MAVVYSTNFDADTVGTLPAGWTAIFGTWAVAAANPVSSPNTLKSSTGAQFDTVLRTGTADVDEDTQTLSYKFVDASKQLCPIWRSTADFANAYVSNFELNSGSASSVLFFKRTAGAYGQSTTVGFTAPVVTAGDTVRVERKSAGAVHEVRIWNATTGTRPASATATFTEATYTTGFSGIFAANTGTPGFDDYLYESASAATSLDIAYNNAAISYSPYNWDDTGTARVSSCPGAYVAFSFTGTSIAAKLTALTGLTNYPALRVWIDNGPPADIAITSGMTAATLGTGLAAGSHTIRLMILRVDDASGGRWAATNAVKITGFTIDADQTVSAVTARTKRAIFYGDSLAQGVRVLSGGTFTGDDASQTVPVLLAEALDAEVGVIGFGGSAFAAAGTGDNPALADSYDEHSSGRTRLTGGVVSPAPDYAFCWYGTNPIGGVASTQAQVATAIANFRAVMPTAKIFMVVPCGGFIRLAITAATNAAILAGDTNLAVIDAGTAYQAGLSAFSAPTISSFDGIHPRASAHARLASRYALQVQHEIEPRRFTVVAS